MVLKFVLIIENFQKFPKILKEFHFVFVNNSSAEEDFQKIFSSKKKLSFFQKILCEKTWPASDTKGVRLCGCISPRREISEIDLNFFDFWSPISRWKKFVKYRNFYKCTQKMLPRQWVTLLDKKFEKILDLRGFISLEKNFRKWVDKCSDFWSSISWWKKFV